MVKFQEGYFLTAVQQSETLSQNSKFQDSLIKIMKNIRDPHLSLIQVLNLDFNEQINQKI